MDVHEGNKTQLSTTDRTGNTMDITLLTEWDHLTHSMSIVVVGFNFNLLLFLLLNRRLRSKNSVRLFVNLQVVHILLGSWDLVCTFLFCDFTACKPRGGDTFFIVQVCVWLGILIEMCIALIMYTLDRLFAIMTPFKYEAITSNHVFRAILLSWLPMVTLIVTSMIFFVYPSKMGMLGYYVGVVATSLIAVAATVLIVSNVIVYRVAKIQYEAIQNTHVFQQNETGREKRMLKSTYVCSCIVGSFVVSWLPQCLCNILVYTNIVQGIPSLALHLVQSLPPINSLLDPVFFILFRKDVKRELKLFFKRSDRTSQASVVSACDQNSLPGTPLLEL